MGSSCCSSAESTGCASALYFRYGSSEEVQNAYALRRSTGLPVRCVKSE